MIYVYMNIIVRRLVLMAGNICICLNRCSEGLFEWIMCVNFGFDGVIVYYGSNTCYVINGRFRCMHIYV